MHDTTLCKRDHLARDARLSLSAELERFQTGEADDGDEVGEPRFRHQALAADVTQLLMRTAATCLTASDKMLALGTAAGTVHLLDYGGNEVHSAAFAAL